MAGFDINVIPPADRSKSAIAEHIEIYKRSMDTWAVYNPTDKDYIVYNDRMVSNERWIVPSKDKDIGHGKGIQHVPMFIMERYLNHMGVEIINKKAKEQWDKEKLQYPRAERGEIEERLGLRTTDPREWDIITPILVKGIVSRYGGDEIEEEIPEQPEPANHGLSPAAQALARLGMEGMEMGIEIQQKKEDLVQKIS